jgi:hypothetical protein
MKRIFVFAGLFIILAGAQAQIIGPKKVRIENKPITSVATNKTVTSTDTHYVGETKKLVRKKLSLQVWNAPDMKRKK